MSPRLATVVPIGHAHRTRRRRQGLSVLFSYKMHEANRDLALRELAACEWALVRVALEAMRLAVPEQALTPFLVAQQHRANAKQYLRRARGEEL